MTVHATSKSPPDMLTPRIHRVVHKIDEAPDVVTLQVVPVDGLPLPSFEPAQCAMIGVFGIGDAAISISSPTTTTDYHAYTIRRVGPISAALCDSPVGGLVTVRAPFGRPWPINELSGGRLLIVAGGLGIAPLRAAAYEAAARRSEFDRIAVVYGAKQPDQLMFAPDLERWANAGVEVAVIVDEGDAHWHGPVGVVPDLLGPGPGFDLDWSTTTAFVCGPDVMMHFTAAKLTNLGMPADRIWLTLERNMQCGNALCGHCQLGPMLICRDGPVVNYERIGPFHAIPDL